jgi:hypothetical protein
MFGALDWIIHEESSRAVFRTLMNVD